MPSLCRGKNNAGDETTCSVIVWLTLDNKSVDDVVAAAKSGSQALEQMTDLLHKLAGPLFSEVGLMLGDSIRVYRVKNWSRCERRIAEMFAEANAEPHAIPPRQFLSMLEAASLEDEATLQELSAALIANAALAADPMPSAFITFLKELSPHEAKGLAKMWEEINNKFEVLDVHKNEPDSEEHCEVPAPRDVLLFDSQKLSDIFSLAVVADKNTLEILADRPRLVPTVQVSIANILRLEIIEKFPVGDKMQYNPKSWDEIRYCFTPIGWMFVNSCQPPAKRRKNRFIV